MDMDAPVVVAKGRNLLAAQIREVALWHGIPLVENPRWHTRFIGQSKSDRQFLPNSMPSLLKFWRLFGGRRRVPRRATATGRA